MAMLNDLHLWQAFPSGSLRREPRNASRCSATPTGSMWMAKSSTLTKEIGDVASGNDCYIANWKMAIELVDFPMENCYFP